MVSRDRLETRNISMSKRPLSTRADRLVTQCFSLTELHVPLIIVTWSHATKEKWFQTWCRGPLGEGAHSQSHMNP